MRPGQTAPECQAGNQRASTRHKGFNEAGADCPGMPAPSCSFHIHVSIASMRPGQTAPECRSWRSSALRYGRRFNEAGADCPGMPLLAKQRTAIRKTLQ